MEISMEILGYNTPQQACGPNQSDWFAAVTCRDDTRGLLALQFHILGRHGVVEMKGGKMWQTRSVVCKHVFELKMVLPK